MDDLTDPIANLVRGAQYLQDRHPELFDKDYKVWVDSSDQARRAKESNMSKKINAGDTLTVGELTDDYLGAVIEVGTLVDIDYRFTLGGVVDLSPSMKSLWTPKARVGGFYRNTPVTIITPPPVVQPDEPKILGQCIRIEGDDEWLGIVADPQGESCRIWDTGGYWFSWGSVLRRAGDRQIIVSDPPRWPNETPVVPERIEAGEWPDDDTHLRAWVWVDSEGDPWGWHTMPGAVGGVGWSRYHDGSRYRNPRFGPWTRGERVE